MLKTIKICEFASNLHPLIMMQFGSVGECIYCGDRSGKLSKEHIIAFGLGGEEILLNASCGKCQKITSKFELIVLRKELFQIRVKLDLPSRKSIFPNTLPLVVRLGDYAKTVELPTSEHPTLAIFLEYPLPGILGGDAPENGINIIGFQTHQIGGPPLKEVMKSLGASTLDVEYISHGNSFERMLAKIALGYAIAAHGLNAVRSSPLRSIILGSSEVVGGWIGMSNPNPLISKKFHRVILEKRGDWIIARIRLFSSMPEYLVVVVEGEKELKPSIELPVLTAMVAPMSSWSKLSIKSKDLTQNTFGDI